MPSANHRLGRNGAVCLAAALLLLTGQPCGLWLAAGLGRVFPEAGWLDFAQGLLVRLGGFVPPLLLLWRTRPRGEIGWKCPARHPTLSALPGLAGLAILAGGAVYSLAAVCLAPLGYQPPVSAGLEPGWQGAGQLVLSVLLPAVAEEAIFRKEILGRLLGAGERPALLASAVLFALLHGDAAQAASALAAGLVLGLVALRWGAGWAAAVHLANNLLALLGTGVWPAAALLVLGLPGLYKLVWHPRWLPRAGGAGWRELTDQPFVAPALVALVLLLWLQWLGL